MGQELRPHTYAQWRAGVPLGSQDLESGAQELNKYKKKL